MSRKLVIGLMLFMFLPFQGTAKEVSGAEIPEKLERAGITFVLNGAGIRSRFFVNIYVSALYLEDRSQDSEKILRDDRNMGIRLQIVSGFVDQDNLKSAIKDGFESATGGNTQPIQPQIERFLELMSEEVNKGDYFDFIYLQSSGLRVYKNDTFLEDIKGLNFKRAFFGIWLGDDPVDDDLKEEMLGL
ncbi:MAG: chalcone isomerase family protein [Proteobacteria bacterium]|nr:chalcone isomerase family protein [Pseudomonadota bacterium]